MILTAKDIAEITRLLDESHFSELRLEIGDFRLRVSRGGRRSRALPERETKAVAPSPAPSHAPAQAPKSNGPGPGEVDIPAPLLGNFYHAPRPGDPVFVEAGARVEEGSTIGIIEVMKLMNPIRAGVAGIVVAMLAENGKPVEEGQPLVRVRVG